MITEQHVSIKKGHHSKLRRVTLAAITILLVTVVVAALNWAKQHRIERDLDRAVTLTNYSAVLTPEGTNILNAIGPDAIPTLLRWSVGKQPPWYKIVNPIRQKLNHPPLSEDIYQNRAKAGAGFFFLRERAIKAVPTLLERLSDENPETRRFSVQMLGAIGPAIGMEAFNQMTNRLTDPEDNVRNDVLWALQFHRIEEYPSESLLPVFVQGLSDTHEVARQNAIIGLVRLGTNASPARASIEKALNDPDQGVSGWAKQWLNGQYLSN